MPDTPSNWFAVEHELLSEIKRARPGPPPLPVIPGYEDLIETRRGGQGVVYRARQTSTKRTVAIKVLLESALGGPLARRRFEREVDVVAALRHPGIVRVYDSGATADGRPYLVMEFVEGQPLDGFLKTHELNGRSREGVRSIVALFADVAGAVSFAHQRGVIHRDLKPSNILVEDQSATGDSARSTTSSSAQIAGPLPRVLDFGLAKLFGEGEQRSMTLSGTGGFMGSLAWASPEQARGDQSLVDVRSDVYALGVMLYHALTGRFPHDSRGPLREVLARIETEPPVPILPTECADDEARTIVFTCLAKDPARRYQSAADLARDLRALLAGEPIMAKADSTLYALRVVVRRHRGAFAAAAAFVMLLGFFAVFMSFLYSKAIRAEASASDRLIEATTANTFLRDLLASPDPASRGREARVIDLLDQMKRRLGTDHLLRPATAAQMQQTLGGTYLGLGQPQPAEVLLRSALDTNLKTLGATHVQTVSVRVNLAGALLMGGKLDEAWTQIEQAEDDARALTPADRIKSGVTSKRGLILMEQGKFALAEEAFRESLSQTLAATPDDAESVTTITNDLAVALRKQSKLDEAERLYREQIALATARLGSESGDAPAVIRLTNNFGSLLHERGRWDEAETAYKDAFERARRILGPAHEDTATPLLNLAKLHGDRSRFDEALLESRQAVEILLGAYGPDSPSTLTARGNLAKLLELTGNLDECEEMTQDVIARRSRVLGEEHPHTLISLVNLTSVLNKRGRKQEAYETQRRVFEIQVRTLGERTFDAIIGRNNVGMCLMGLDRAEEAFPFIDRAATLAAEVMTPAHWVAGAFRANRGRCHLKLGRQAEGEADLRAALDVLVTSVGPTDRRTVNCRASLVELLRATGRTDEAATIEAQAPPAAAAPPPVPVPAAAPPK